MIESIHDTPQHHGVDMASQNVIRCNCGAYYSPTKLAEHIADFEEAERVVRFPKTVRALTIAFALDILITVVLLVAGAKFAC